MREVGEEQSFRLAVQQQAKKDSLARPVAEELELEHPAEPADYFAVERAAEELLLQQLSQRPRPIHIYHLSLDLPLPLLDVFLGHPPVSWYAHRCL